MVTALDWDEGSLAQVLSGSLFFVDLRKSHFHGTICININKFLVIQNKKLYRA